MTAVALSAASGGSIAVGADMTALALSGSDGSNRVTKWANRTRSPGLSTRAPVIRSSLTKVPPVEFKSRIVTCPALSVVTKAWRRLTNWSSRNRSAVSEWPITISDPVSMSGSMPGGLTTTSRGKFESPVAIDASFNSALQTGVRTLNVRLKGVIENPLNVR
jgi:hypothetical protein